MQRICVVFWIWGFAVFQGKPKEVGYQLQVLLYENLSHSLFNGPSCLTGDGWLELLLTRMPSLQPSSWCCHLMCLSPTVFRRFGRIRFVGSRAVSKPLSFSTPWYCPCKVWTTWLIMTSMCDQTTNVSTRAANLCSVLWGHKSTDNRLDTQKQWWCHIHDEVGVSNKTSELHTVAGCSWTACLSAASWSHGSRRDILILPSLKLT